MGRKDEGGYVPAFHGVPCDGTGGESAVACSHCDGISSVVNMSDMLERGLNRKSELHQRKEVAMEVLTGEGRCSRPAAILSPGASNATTGAPKVTPKRDARAPPKEWPNDTISEIN